MKKLIVAGIATAMMSGAASAYEYQNIDNNNERAVNTFNRMAFTIANEMEFPESELNPLELMKEKHALAACTIDKIGGDIHSINGSSQMFMQEIQNTKKYWKLGNSRFYHMERIDIDYITIVSYECIDYHPQPKDTIIEFSHINARKEIKKSCDSENTQDVNKCRSEIFEKYENYYLTENGY